MSQFLAVFLPCRASGLNVVGVDLTYRNGSGRARLNRVYLLQYTML